MSPPTVKSLGQNVILLVDKNWEMDTWMGLTSAEARKVRSFIRSYMACFTFKLTDLEGRKCKRLRIQLDDGYPIFRRPYKLSLSERDGSSCDAKNCLMQVW